MVTTKAIGKKRMHTVIESGHFEAEIVGAQSQFERYGVPARADSGRRA